MRCCSAPRELSGDVARSSQVDAVPARRLKQRPGRNAQSSTAPIPTAMASRRPRRTDYLSSRRKRMRDPVPSPIYDLFAQAMAGRQQILCIYDGCFRELCPHILGYTKEGQEAALTYQFGGQSTSGLPPGSQWRCLHLAKVSNVRLRAGPWHAGPRHVRPQDCVHTVDLDINPSSPYRPKRRRYP
jgi:hypothetical protein